jgi:hypothetical protein
MMSPESIGQLAERFVRFADETRGSSALYTALSPAIADDRELLELLLEAPPTQRRANLLFAAVHDLLLAGVDHPLARYYPSVAVAALPCDQGAFEAFRDLCLSRRASLREIIAVRRTQTNEVRRSIALLPVIQQISAVQPIALVEIGASAGLNLLVDHFRYRYGEGPWIGAAGSPVAIQCETRGAVPVPVRIEPPRIAFRIGLDSHPLDASSEADARWLMACVWPEQLDRLQLLRSALEVARRSPPRLAMGNAVEALEDVIGEVPEDLPVCLFHSATIPYFTDDECAAFVWTVDRIGGERRLHWVSLEGGALHTFGPRLPFSRLHVPRSADRPTDIVGLLGYAYWIDRTRHDRVLARVDMHGRWIEWTDASADLRA